MIWYVGDTAIGSAVVEFAGADELKISARPEATPEQVWTEQKHDSRGAFRTPVTVICFLSQREYDSEATIWHLLSATPIGSRIIYIVPPGTKKSVLEGLDHYKGLPISCIQLESMDEDEILAKLRAA